MAAVKCPYCAKEIDERAVVCPFCRQFLVAPLVRRIETLESELSKRKSPETVGQQGAGPFPAVLAAVLGAVATAGFFFVLRTASGVGPAYSDWAPLLAIVLPPAVLGFLLGRTWLGGRGRAYLLSGVGMGVFNLLAIWSLLYSPDRPFNWPWALTVFPVGQALVFVVAGLLGKKMTPETVDRPTWSLEGILKSLARGSERLERILTLLLTLISMVATALTHIGLRSG